MPDRKNAPEIALPREVEIPEIARLKLANGLPVYVVNAGTEPVVKVEWLWKAGKSMADMPLVAVAVNALLEEGTRELSSRQISERIDFYGAAMNAQVTGDIASLSIYSRNDQLENALPVFCDVACNPSFPEREVEIFKKNELQEFMVALEQTEVLSSRAMRSRLFGDHPYGKNIQATDYQKLDRQMLIDFFNAHYTAANSALIVSGRADDDILRLLDRYIGSVPPRNANETKPLEQAALHFGEPEFVHRKDAVQSSIRMAFGSPPSGHQDYFPVRILTTLFGGYFGSRLMMNLREDKGYTYGIGVRPVEKAHAHYLALATQVGAQVDEKALHEIYTEMERLRNEPPNNYEMETVRNFMVGSVLRSLDGPFAIESVFKGLYLRGLELSYMKDYLQAVKDITPDDIQRVAQKYLTSKNTLEVVSGPVKQ